MAKTVTLSNSVLDALVGNAAFPSYAPIYIALADDGAEITSGNAARVQVPASSWNSASGGNMTNSAAVTFPEGGGDASADTFLVFDAATGGTALREGTLNTGFTWASNVTPEFPIGALTLSES